MNLLQKKQIITYKVELDYFKLLFSNEILDLLVEELNKYYINILIDTYGTEYYQKNKQLLYLIYMLLKGLIREDILAFIGIRIYMGLHKMPSTIKHYWKRGLHQTKINKIMNSKYFWLGKPLHFPEKERKKTN